VITLSPDGQGLVRIDNWEDVNGIPGYVRELDPASATLKSILGSYQIADRVPCGLANCRQPHSRGYLVATDDGRVTNIGNVCGKTNFSVEFETMRRKFDDDIRRKERREQIDAAKSRAQRLLDELATLRREERGADWVRRTSRTLLNPQGTLPSYLVTAVRDMVRTRSADITVEREATQDEIDRMDVAARRRIDRDPDQKLYVSEVVGNLDGLAALFSEHDLHEVVAIDLIPKLEELLGVDPGSLSDSQQIAWVKWIAEIDDKMDRARTAVRTGRRLLTMRNIAQLTELAKTSDDARQIMRFAKSLQTE